MRILPRALLSRLFGTIADTPLPKPVRALVLGTFARLVGARPEEAELPLGEYGSLNAFFVRRLAPGARAWPDDEEVVTSPVDGVLAQFGDVREGRLLQAKGRWYTASRLLGGDDWAAPFVGGRFASLYLSPRHYHRIHAPCGGTLSDARYVPGALFPVNAPAVAAIPELFATNERVVCVLSSTRGRVAVVAIGAYNVGRISTAFDPDWSSGRSPWVTNRRPRSTRERRYDPPVTIERAQEIMAFHMGSSVVMLFEAGTHDWTAGLETGQELRLGSALAIPTLSGA